MHTSTIAIGNYSGVGSCTTTKVQQLAKLKHFNELVYAQNSITDNLPAEQTKWYQVQH